MPEEYKIDFPENIIELAERLFGERARKENERLEKRKGEKLREERIIAERMVLGMPYAEKVFKWAQAFRESEIGKKLMEISHIPIAYRFVLFFADRIEGKEWTGLGVSLQRGVFWTHGRKYEFHHYIETSGELAGSVDADVLKLACECIDNGRVWKCIEERFDYLKPEVRQRHIQEVHKRLWGQE